MSLSPTLIHFGKEDDLLGGYIHIKIHNGRNGINMITTDFIVDVISDIVNPPYCAYDSNKNRIYTLYKYLYAIAYNRVHRQKTVKTLYCIAVVE